MFKNLGLRRPKGVTKRVGFVLPDGYTYTDEEGIAPDLYPVLGGCFTYEELAGAFPEALQLHMDTFDAWPMVCQRCKPLGLHWSTTECELERNGQRETFGPLTTLCCVQCGMVYPVDELPPLARQGLRPPRCMV